MNRVDLCLKSFSQILGDPRIDDIVIVDDASEMENFDRLFNSVKGMAKVELYRNAITIGMGANKRKAISFARNPWVIIFDDDNEISSQYVDAIERMGTLGEETFYLPCWARPSFDFREYEWDFIDKTNIKEVLETANGQALFNVCNMIVSKDRYLAEYEHPTVESASDTLWMNYLHLSKGGNFYVVPGMEYNHLVHDESGFMKDIKNSLEQADIIRAKILAL